MASSLKQLKNINMKYSFIFIALSVEAVVAFPFVAKLPGVDSSLLRNVRRESHDRRQQSGGANPGGPLTCPNNPHHAPAAGITAQYPYNNAKNGAAGNGKGGYQVPAPGDDAHKFIAPGSAHHCDTLVRLC